MIVGLAGDVEDARERLTVGVVFEEGVPVNSCSEGVSIIIIIIILFG